jgi:hypothetical protein
VLWWRRRAGEEAVADLFDRINIFETDEVPPGLTYEIEGRRQRSRGAERAGFRPLLPEGAEPPRVLPAGVREVKAAALFEPGDGPDTCCSRRTRT